MSKKKCLITVILIVTAFTSILFFRQASKKIILGKDLPMISVGLDDLDNYVAQQEKPYRIKPDNESRIIWADKNKREKTAYCLLYLHGFSASWYEGYPVNIKFAEKFGMNAYFPRLASHGLITDDPLIDMTPDSLWNSAKQALVMAHQLGEKVIIMSTSTGGTLSLQLAADYPALVDALILYSPNIRINNTKAWLLSKPFGLKLARMTFGGLYREFPDSLAEKCKYWNCKYRLESTVYLQQLIDATMKKSTFRQIDTPTFVGYYYKDKNNQDTVVKVSSILWMFNELATPENKKKAVNFPDAGDHVIANQLKSGAVEEVMQETIKFTEAVLDLTPRFSSK